MSKLRLNKDQGLSLAIVKAAMKTSGRNWVLMTNDYVWGHNTAKATRAMVAEAFAEEAVSSARRVRSSSRAKARFWNRKGSSEPE